MSEEPKITSEVKTKNPKRVEQGKKLVAFNAAAKEERKMREKILSEQSDNSVSDTSDSGNGSTLPLVVFGGVVVIGTVGYYAYKKKKEDSKPAPAKQSDDDDF